MQSWTWIQLYLAWLCIAAILGFRVHPAVAVVVALVPLVALIIRARGTRPTRQEPRSVGPERTGR